jgi:hypothetical protein
MQGVFHLGSNLATMICVAAKGLQRIDVGTR